MMARPAGSVTPWAARNVRTTACLRGLGTGGGTPDLGCPSKRIEPTGALDDAGAGISLAANGMRALDARAARP
ncbi:hypothetical protein SGFS_051010 [Streptomyces graminofaciens]|uniref:Uncharacterized protein n=1 Tax=Streptomyces graminofaciens TaxID=68212 RepID=A0ABM7FBI7_9ACTN|nr:hypothetical protein SGFS_051010 [Streptomyces graminofaciens]